MDATLEDFRKAAASGNGVDLIPFPDLRARATAIADEVQRSKATSQWNYDTYEKQKNNLLDEKVKKEQEIKDKAKEIAELKSKDANFNTSAQDDELKELEAELKDTLARIEKLNTDLEEAAEEWKRLWNARGGLRELFADAMDEIKAAGANPDKYYTPEMSESDKETLKKSIYVIEGMIQDGEEEHKKQEEGAKVTEGKFRELIKLTK